MNDYYYKYLKYKNKYKLLKGGENIILDKEYPYYKYFLSKKKLKKILKDINLKNINIIIKKYEEDDFNFKTKTDEIKFYKKTGKTHIIDIKKNMKTEILTDYFVEEVRLECKNVHKKMTEKEYYNLYYKNKFDEDIKSGMNILKAKREFKINSKILACGLFPINLVYYIYQKYKPQNILDMSAGWGDRLLGALVYKCDNYYGVDPNLQMEEKYKEIINFYKRNDGIYKVIPKKFEDTTDNDFDNKKFDIMFSSPPYFLAEEYTKEKGYGEDLEIWLNDFLFTSLRKVWELLNMGGRVLLVIDDTYYKRKKIEYVDRTIKFMKSLKYCIYEGMIQYRHDNVNAKKVIQPIWIFYKKKRM
jgi:16S rRNA G966 N2-methylase RsmD